MKIEDVEKLENALSTPTKEFHFCILGRGEPAKLTENLYSNVVPAN